MILKRTLSLLLVILMLFVQVISSFAAMGVEFSVTFNNDGTATVVSSVYSDIDGEPAGQVIDYQLFDGSNNPVVLNPASSQVGNTASSVVNSVYYYNMPTGTFNTSPGAGSYTVVASVNGGSEIGRYTVAMPTSAPSSSSSITSANPVFDKFSPADVIVDVTYNGNTLSAIKYGTKMLLAPDDYQVSGNQIILTGPFLNSLPLGDAVLTFEFSDGIRNLTVNVNRNSDPMYLQSFSVNLSGLDKYIEFRTKPFDPNGPDLGTATSMFFEIKGGVPEKMFSSENIHMNTLGKIFVEKVGSLTPPAITKMDGYLNQVNFDTGVTEKVANVHIDLGAGLEYDTTYRIKFSGEILSAVLEGINSYTYIPEGLNPQNVMIQINTPTAMAQAVTQLDNVGVTTTTSVSLMEIGGEGMLGASGSYVSYNFDFSKGFDDVRKIGLISEGNWNSPVTIDASGDINSFGAYGGVTGTYSVTQESGKNIFKMFMDLSAGQNITGSSVAFSSYGNVAEEFARAVTAYWWNHEDIDLKINYADYNGAKYAVLYNSAGDLIGWKAFGYDVDTNKMYVNPQFKWAVKSWDDALGQDVWQETVPPTDTGTGLPVQEGMNNFDLNRYLKIVNSGTNNMLMLEGTLEYYDTDTQSVSSQPFQVTTENWGEPDVVGTQYIFLEFTNILDPMFKWEDVRSLNQPSNWINRRIPVHPYKSNTITLSYSYQVDGVTYTGTKQFMWKPNAEELSNNLLGGFNFDGEGNKIGMNPANNSITLRSPGEFSGNLANLKLQFYYTGELVPPQMGPDVDRSYQDGISTIYATLSATSTQTVYDDLGNQNTFTTFTYTQGTDTFTLDGVIINGIVIDGITHNNLTIGQFQALDPMKHKVFLRSRLVYEDGDIAVSRDSSEFLNEVEVDAVGPASMWGVFKGQDTAALNTFKVKLQFDEFIDVASLQGNVQITLKDDQQVVHNATITSIEGLYEDWQKAGEPYKAVLVTFTVDTTLLTDSMERNIKVLSVSDILGNVYTYNDQQPMQNQFHTDTHFRTSVYDENGYLITNAEVGLVEEKPVPLTTGSDWYDERRAIINKNGVLDGWVKPGTYTAYVISTKDDKGQWIDKNVDITFEIPFADQEQPYYQIADINLPAANVTGTSKRIDGRLYKEKLMFISEYDYQTYYLQIQAQMDQFMDPNQPPPDPSQPEPDLKGALEILDRFYIKTVETDANGNFKLYLDPGVSGKQYRLLGKRLGKGIFVEPVQEYLFTVTTTGYSFGNTVIEFPPPALDGYLKDSSGNPVPFSILEIGGDTGRYMAETDEQGYFEVYIDNVGSYSIVTIRSGFNGSGTGRLSVFGATFDVVLDGVTGNYTATNLVNNLGVSVGDFNSLTVPTPNVRFKVGIGRDASNALVQSEKQFYALWITAVDEGAGVPFYLQNIDVPAENGTYELYVPSGSYKFTGLNSFEVSVPSWQNGSSSKYVTVTQVGGASQRINEAASVDQNTGVVTATFTGYNFTAGTTLSEYEVDLSGYFDTHLQLSFDDGTPLAGANVSVEDTTESGWYNARTGSDGKAYFYFGVQPDGSNPVTKNFRVNGYDYQRKWFSLEQDASYGFTVSSDNNPDNKAAKTITIIKPNFYGYVFSSTVDDNIPADDTATIENAWIDIKKLGTDTTKEEWFGTGSDQDGFFTTALTQEGQYIINSVGSYDDWFEVSFRFDVVLDNMTGKYVAIYPAGHELAGQPLPMPLNVGKPTPNFSGYLFKKVVKDANGDVVVASSTPYTGFDGTETEDSGVNLILLEADVSQEQLMTERWRYEKWVRVGLDGSFGAVLDTSKSYVIFGVSTPRRWHEFAERIPVTLNAQSIIYPPEGNFNGTVGTFSSTVEELNTNGIKLLWGGIGLEKIGTVNQWDWVEITEDGSFGKNLEVGASYRINDVNFELEYLADGTNPKYRKNFNYRINKVVTITDTPQTFNFRPNFKTVISGLSISTENLWENRVGVSLRRVVESTDPQYQTFLKEPWKFDIWGDGMYNPATGAVEFISILEPGKYNLVRVHETELTEGFELKGVSGTTASGDGTITYSSGQYLMTLDFASNVTGYIAQDGVRVANAWVNMERVVATSEGQTGDLTFNNIWFGTKTDANGEFALKLQDGNYRINGYNTEGGWVNGTWSPGQWVQLSYEFKVINKQLCSSSGTAISQIVLSTNVKGKVMKPDKSSATGYKLVPNAWLQIWPTDAAGNVDWSDWSKSMWANTNDLGIFKLTLLPGKYKVTDIGGHNFFMKVDLVFEIDASGNLVVSSNYLDSEGYFIVKPAAPNLTGTVYKDAAKLQAFSYGNIVVKPKTAKDDDWNSSRWIPTDELGNFSAALSDGEWKIVEMSNWNTWIRVNIPFSVSGNTVTPLASGMVVDSSTGNLSIYPPEPNVKGIVMDKQGSQLNDKAWITIKPSDAAEHDWSKAIWTEYRHYEDTQGENKNQFRLNLEPGSYKIVDVGGMGFWYKTNIPFTVDEQLMISSGGGYVNQAGLLVVSPPAPNVTGTAFGTVDGVEKPISKGWINFARYIGDTQVSMDGNPISGDEWKDEFSGIYWNHTIGAEIDESGKFSVRLPAGATYKIVSVGGEGTWYQPYTEVTIVGNEVKVLEVRRPGPNVTITIKDVPQDIVSAQSAWLDIYQEKDGTKHFMPAEFKEKTAEGYFVFEAYLKNGKYTVAFFGTPDGAGIELGKELNVNGKTTLDISIQNEASIAMVTGTVSRNGVQVAEKVWVAITSVVNGETVKKKVQTNNNGEFKFKLPHGTTWTLAEIVTNEDGYVEVTNPGTEYTLNITTQTGIEWLIEITDFTN